ncbi:MAG: ABC transporter substrate-binding protein [Treponema sp.]|nr:ABC transporter substrate-binding protein [Treponema sp.]
MRRNYVVLSVLAVCAAVVLTVSCSKKTEVKPAAAETSSDGASPFLQQLRKTGVLKVGSSGDSPFAYIDQKTGSFDGVDAEIIKEAAKRLGIQKVEMSLIPFSELILNLNNGNIDIIADCMYTRADRGEKVYFGDIWYTQGGGLLASEKSPVNGQSTFDPKTTRVGYTEGTAWQYVVQGWQKDGLIKDAVATGDQSESIVALQYGKIDAFLTDSTVVESLFANSPDTLKGLKLCSDYKDVPETIGRIAPAVSFDHIAFMKELNNVVMTLRDEGFIDGVFKKYGLDPKLHTITNDPAQRLCTVNSRDN